MNLSLTRKRSLFSELKNDTYFRTLSLIVGAVISIFGLFPFVGCVWHKYSLPLDTSVQLGDTSVGYFDFMLSGFVICAIAALTLCAAYLVCYGITIAIGYFKAMNRSTYLPLTKEEIEAKGLTSIKKYTEYIYNQLIYLSDAMDGCYEAYCSDGLREELKSAMIAYFGESEKDNIQEVLHYLFDCCHTDAVFTEDTWKNLEPQIVPKHKSTSKK